MLNTAWIALAVAVTLIAILARQPALFVVGIMLLLSEGASWLWGRQALHGVIYRRRLGQKRAFFGEHVPFETIVENRKLLPLAWLAVQDELPAATPLVVGRAIPSHKPRRMLLNNLFTLRWYERIVRRYSLRCETRGEHLFGPAHLRTGDVFGFVERDVDVPGGETLLVLPRIVPLLSAPIPSRQVVGTLPSPRRIIEDPLRMAGLREYAPGDSVRRIHWKASARAGKLLSKELEPTTETELILALNASTTDPPWLGIAEEKLELAVMVTVSLAQTMLRSGRLVGVFANSDAGSSGRVLRIPPSRAPDQFARILDACARISGFERLPFATCLERETRGLLWATTLVAISAVMTDELLAALLRLRRAGRTVGLILVGDDHARPSIPGVPTWIVRGEEEWRTLETLVLA